MIRKKHTTPPGPIEAEQGEDQAVPDDLATAAGQLHLDAEQARLRASQEHAEARAVVDAAEQEAARITAEARSKALAIVAEATAAERQAAALEERAQWLSHAAAGQDQAAEAGRQAGALTGEREDLARQITSLNGRLGELREEREDLAGQLGDARQAARVAEIAEVRARLSATDEAIAVLTGQREAVQARASQIGDGTASFPGELVQALSAAGRHRAEARRLTNLAYPASAQAIRDGALADVRGALEGNLARIAAEGTRKPESPLTVVVR